MVVLIVMAVLIVLIIAYASAKTFAAIASMKGHDDNRYFWWTFVFPMLGALMVVALPDRKQHEDAKRIMTETKMETPAAVSNAVPAKAAAVVLDGRSNDDAITCPACGKVQRADRRVCWQCGAKFAKN